MSQSKWTIVNGVKWEVSPHRLLHSNPAEGKNPPTLWSPVQDIENPTPIFTYRGKVYREMCELTLEEALRFIK